VGRARGAAARGSGFRTGVLTVGRVVVELTPRFHPDGGRFIVKSYPKDREHRRLRLSAQMVSKIKAFIELHGLGDDDLLFAMPQLPQQPSLRALAEPSTFGLTEPNDAGRRYRHGTLTPIRLASAGASTAGAPMPATAPSAVRPGGTSRAPAARS